MTVRPVPFYSTVALTILFVGCKLAGVIDWSWLRVLSPALIWWVLVFVVEFVIAVMERKRR